MVKNVFIVMFVLLLCGLTGWLIYDRTMENDSTTAASIGIGLGPTTPSPSPTVGDYAMQDVSKIVNPSGSAEPGGAPGAARTLEGGVQVRDTKVGVGEEAKPGMMVSVHYTGTLQDGTKFDSSLDRGKPFEFILGGGMVIKGWDVGIVGMKIGGKRTLVIPPAMAYGEAGAGGVIPPDATLLFDVELLDAQTVAPSQQ